jgi:hypothetical protein
LLRTIQKHQSPTYYKRLTPETFLLQGLLL